MKDTAIKESLPFSTIKELEDAHQLKTYSKYEIALESGCGARVTDAEGKQYLDFYGGHAVTITGHCHPRVVEAICAQAKQLLFYSNLVYNSARAKAVQALTSYAPQGFKVFLCNSGAEANETALKISRRFTGRELVIAMHGSFHGRTYGAMSVTGSKKYRIFKPELGGVEFVEFGNIEQVEALCKSRGPDIAAILLEPVQSMAGVRIAPPQYFSKLRALCDSVGALLIFDEVQTAFGRVGTPFYGSLVQVTPDLITTAKAVASGFPMGVTFVRDHVAATVKNGEQGTTFGGGPVACAAALATLEVIQEEKLAQQAIARGTFLRQGIEAMGLAGIKEIRQIGLMLGIEFDFEIKALVAELLERGVIVGGSDDGRTMRLLPPLIISEEDCRDFLSALHDSMHAIRTSSRKVAHG